MRRGNDQSLRLALAPNLRLRTKKGINLLINSLIHSLTHLPLELHQDDRQIQLESLAEKYHKLEIECSTKNKNLNQFMVFKGSPHPNHFMF